MRRSRRDLPIAPLRGRIGGPRRLASPKEIPVAWNARKREYEGLLHLLLGRVGSKSADPEGPGQRRVGEQGGTVLEQGLFEYELEKTTW